MSKRVPGSMRTRQPLCDLIEGRLSSPDGRAEPVRLATRLQWTRQVHHGELDIQSPS